MESDLIRLEKETLHRWCAGNETAWTESSAPQLSYIDPFLVKPIYTIPDLVKHLESPGMIHPSSVSELTDPKLVTLDRSAILSYLCELTSKDGRVESWNITRVYFRDTSNWQLVHSHLSLVGHVAPEIVVVPIPVSSSTPLYQGILGELMMLESNAMFRWRNGDPWGFIENSAADVSYMDSGTPKRIDGKQALSAEYALREGKIHYEVMEFIDPRVQQIGTTAVLHYRFFSTSLNPDGSIASRIPWYCTEVFDSSSGSWLVRHNHWSMIHGLKP